MEKQTEEMVLQTIENESKYIDIKPFSHNIVGLELQMLSEQFNYTNAQIKEVVKKYNLHKKGWAYVLDDN